MATTTLHRTPAADVTATNADRGAGVPASPRSAPRRSAPA
jgi:hypothetical protein